MLSSANENGLIGVAFSVLLTSVLGLIVYIVSIVIYRVSLHPLANYPGPFLAKITNLYALYHAWKGDRHLDSSRCHEKYGDIYRNGPDSLSFNTTTALEAIYGHKSNCWKGEFYTMLPAKKNVYSVHSEIDKERHAHKRRVLSQAFSDRALKSMEVYILNQIRIFCAQVSTCPQPVELASQFEYLTGDILGDLCFGQSFYMQEKPGNRFIPDLVQATAKQILLTCTVPAIRNWKLDYFFPKEMTSRRAAFTKLCMSLAAQRTQASSVSDRKDFFHYLLTATDPITNSGFAPPELWAESSLLLVAGSDTTSTALSAIFFYLTHSTPSALSTLTHEIRTTFHAVEDIRSGPALSSCTYLRACVDESLRCSPPIPGFLPREVLSGGAVIDGHHLPAGTVVGCAAYALHHKETYFADSFVWRPERWLVEASPSSDVNAGSDSGHNKPDADASAAMTTAAFCAFGLGPRGCIGRNMAYMELLTVVARALWLFDIRRAGWLGEGLPDTMDWGRQRPDEYQLEDVFVSRKVGPQVEFVARA